MGCEISGEQLWSWIDREAPELDEHLATCPVCRERAAKIRDEIGVLASDAAVAIPLPDEIGPYTIKRLLGEGGQALVYEAEQPSPRRLVALKVLKGGHLVDKTRVKQFRRETQTLARLNHPSIATIYEAGRTQEGLHYFAMELSDGKPLHKFVKEETPDRKDLLRLFVELCTAIGYAHDRGVIHRDLKPSNIMVDAQGKPKILDFGLARLTHADLLHTVTATKDGRIEGTPRYMSPEQALGKFDKIDARSDVYSLGVILYEMLTGVPPNDVTQITPQAITTICEEIPRRPSSIDSSLRGDLDAVLLKALEKQPGHRYQTVADFAEDITRYLDGEPIGARHRSVLYFVRKKLSRRRSWFVTGLVAVAIIVTGIWSINRVLHDPAKTQLDILGIKYALHEAGATDLLYQEASRAGSRYPGLPEAMIVRAYAYFLNNEKSMASVILEQKLAEDPSMWPCKALRDEIDPRPDGNGPEFSGWKDEFTTSADAWYLRSFATLDIKKSFEWATEALRIDPEHRLAYASMKHLARNTRDTETALAATSVLINTSENAANWIRQKIMILARLGRYQDALDECDEIIDRWPGNYHGYYLHARLSRRLKRYKEAAHNFSLAIKKLRKHGPFGAAWIHYHRGTVSWILGDEEGAIADYQQAHELLTYPTFANARLFILLEQTGRSAEARDCASNIRRAITIDPWLVKIFDCLEGNIAPDQLAAFAEAGGDSIRICEAYYYAAEASLLGRSELDAIEWFQKCVDTGIKCDPERVLEPVSEYELAVYRLALLEQKATQTQ